jgi:hypothetical protein
MVRAWLAGIVILIAVHILLWGVVAATPVSELLRNLLFAGPPAAALVTTYLSPRNRLLMGMSLAPCGALIGYAAQQVYAALGYHVDRLGVDAISTLQVLLVFNVLYALVGSLLGLLISCAVGRSRDSRTSTTS